MLEDVDPNIADKWFQVETRPSSRTIESLDQAYWEEGLQVHFNRHRDQPRELSRITQVPERFDPRNNF